MKQTPAFLIRFVQNVKSIRHFRILFLVALASCVGNSARAADTAETTWTGTTSGSWSVSTNWSGGVLTGTGTSAVFNSPFTNQPSVSTALTNAQGIWVTGSSTTTGNSGLVTIGSTGSGSLKIAGGATLDGVGNMGILLDGAGNNSLTINAPITTNGSMSFQVNNSGTLTINGFMSLASSSAVLTVGNTALDNANSTFNFTGGASSATGIIDIKTNGTVNMTGTYGGISSGGHLYQLNAGTLNFTGTMTENTGTNPVSGWLITGGTANFNSADSIGVGQLETTGGTTNETATNAISGTTLVMVNGGTLNLSLANNYTGGTTLTGSTTAGGTLVVGNNGSLGTGGISFSGGTGTNVTLSASTAVTMANSVTANGAGTETIGGSNSITFTGTLSQTGAGSRVLVINNTGGTTFGDFVLTTAGSTAARTFVFAGSGNTTITGTTSDGAFAGSSILDSNSGTLSLEGAGTFTGGVTAGGGGTILLGTNTSLGTGTLTLNGGGVGASVDLSGPGNTVANAVNMAGVGAVNGTSNITFSGAFALTAAANETLTINNTGTTSFSGSTFSLAAHNLAINGAGNIVIGDVVTSGSNLGLSYSGTGTLTLAGANTFGTPTTSGATTNLSSGTILLTNQLALQNAAVGVNGGTLVFDSSVSGHAFTLGNVQGSGNVALQDNAGTPNAVALTIGDTQSVTYSGALSGGGSVIKVGTDTETFTNTNIYTGTTTVLNGGLTLGDSGSLTQPAGSVGNSAVTIGSAGANVNTAFTVTGASQNPGTVQRSASLTYNGSFNTNGSNFTDTGSVGGNTEDEFGALTLTAGELRGNFAPNVATNLEVVFDSVTRSAGTEFVAASSGTVGGASITSATANVANIVFTAAPSLTGGGGSAGSSTVSVLPWAFVNGGLATYDSTNGLRALNTTTEETALATSNTSLMNAKIAANTTLSTATSVNALQSITAASTITLGAGTSGDTTALTINSGAIAVQKSLTIGAVAGNGVLAFGSTEGIVNVSDSQVLTINSVITGTGGLTIGEDITLGTHKATTVLAGANTYSGITTFEGNGPAGDLVALTNSLVLQNTTLDYNNYGASFTFGNGTTTGQTAYTFGGLKGAQNITLANNNATVGAVALTVGGDNDSTTYSGVLSDGTTAGGSLVKTGSGSFTLSGASTYTGGTEIAGGKLLANNLTGSATGSGALQVDSGATLGGAGFINSTTNTINGHVQVGNGGVNTTDILTVTASGTTTFSGANLTFNLSTTTPGQGNQLALAGTPTVLFSGTSLTLNLQGVGGIPDGTTYTLFTSSVGGTGDGGSVFSGLDLTAGNVITGITYNPITNSQLVLVSNGSGGFNIDLEVEAVPEPGTWALMLGGLALLVIFQRARRKS